jgi:hypothetical protein
MSNPPGAENLEIMLASLAWVRLKYRNNFSTPAPSYNREQSRREAAFGLIILTAAVIRRAVKVIGFTQFDGYNNRPDKVRSYSLKLSGCEDDNPV